MTPDAGVASPSPQKPAGPAKRRGPLAILVLLVVVAAGGAAVFYGPALWNGAGTGGERETLPMTDEQSERNSAEDMRASRSAIDDLKQEADSLGERLGIAEARLDALESVRRPAPPGEPVDLAPLRARIEAAVSALAELANRMAELEAQSGAGAQQPQPPADAEPLIARVAAVEERAAGLAQGADALKATLDGIETRIRALESAAPPVDLVQRLDGFAAKSDQAALESRVTKLETQDTAGALRRAALALALVNLTRAAAGPTPFMAELAALSAVAADDPAIAELGPFAAAGAPTPAMLEARFPKTVRAALDAERAGAAQGFLTRLWANLKGLVSLRRVGDVDGDDTESRLARAQVRLAEGRLDLAAGEVRALQGPAAAAAAEWLGGAEARLALDRATTALTARLVEELARQSRDMGRPAE